ncbi:MAG: acyl-CoA dehydratase activase [Chloroflexota bacterium]|nr:acyl-CoA dehydratase activase [Chloroflexota bacterium]
MRSIGIDIGSRTVKLVMMEEGEVLLSRKADSSYDPLAVCRDLLDDIDCDSIIATGYGRHMLSEHFECRVISEIKAFAVGARALFPDCQAVLDIGGQDTKAISLDGDGCVVKFEMNDKCAAGTGRFLEIMAAALRYPLGEFGQAALQAKKAAKISSMCTVFAESEVISLLTGGALREEVALGIHEAIGQRTLGMLGRLPSIPGLVFAGGVAYNQCVRRLLEERLGIPMLIPPEPQIVGALGAAVEGLENYKEQMGRLRLSR